MKSRSEQLDKKEILFQRRRRKHVDLQFLCRTYLLCRTKASDEEIITLLKQQEKIKRDYALATPPDKCSLLPQNLKKGSRMIAFKDAHGDVEALRN